MVGPVTSFSSVSKIDSMFCCFLNEATIKIESVYELHTKHWRVVSTLNICRLLQ
jgi:hypothetical protein